MIPRLIVSALLVAAVVLPGPPASAQLVREDGTSSIAGLLGGAYGSEAMWSFRSGGREILFASLDAEVYAVNDDHGHVPAAGGEGECGEGSARFCLQVLDQRGDAICTAGRPTGAPGWQRDPRMACPIPDSSFSNVYWIRVALLSDEGTCGDPSVVLPDPVPLLLDVSLRGVAFHGSQVVAAVAASANRF
jgi:hypothetical protein